MASTSQRTRQSRAGGEFRGDATNWYALALVCFALGLLCKPMLVTLPFVLLLLDYWPLGRAARNVPELSDSEFTQHATRNTLARLLIEKLPFMLLCLASSLVTFLVQQKGGAVSPLEALTVLARVANAVVSYARYLGKTFWPQDLSVLYPHPGHWPVWQVAAAVALLVCVTLVVILLRRPMPFAVVGWLWFVGMLVPVIGLVQVGIQSMADRYTYLPSVGILIALVWGVGAAVERWPKLRVASGVAAALAVGACGVLTAMQAGIWANSETLFRHAVTVTEKNFWRTTIWVFTSRARGGWTRR